MSTKKAKELAALLEDQQFQSIVNRVNESVEDHAAFGAMVMTNLDKIDNFYPVLKECPALMDETMREREYWVLFHFHDKFGMEIPTDEWVVHKFGSFLYNAAELPDLMIDDWIYPFRGGGPIFYGVPLDFREKWGANNWERLKEARKIPGEGDPLYGAIFKDDVDGLRECFAQPGFDCSRNRHLLYKACFYNAIKCFNFLLLNGAPLEGGMNAALRCGRTEMIERLLEKGCELRIQSAIRGHQLEIVKWMVETKGVTPRGDDLVSAVNVKASEIVEYLLPKVTLSPENAGHCVSFSGKLYSDLALGWLDLAPPGDTYYIAESAPKAVIEKAFTLGLTIHPSDAFRRRPFDPEIADFLLKQGPFTVELCDIASDEAAKYVADHNLEIGGARTDDVMGLKTIQDRLQALDRFHKIPLWWYTLLGVQGVKNFKQLSTFEQIDITQPDANGGSVLEMLVLKPIYDLEYVSQLTYMFLETGKFPGDVVQDLAKQKDCNPVLKRYLETHQ